MQFWQLGPERYVLELEGLELELRVVHGRTLGLWVDSQTGAVLAVALAALA